MCLLTGKIIYRCKVITTSITQEVIDRVEDIAKKVGNKPPLNFKYRKEGTIREDNDKNDDDGGSITGVEDEDEEEYETNIEADITYNE